MCHVMEWGTSKGKKLSRYLNEIISIGVIIIKYPI